MKLMIINNNDSRIGIFTRLLKSTEYEDCTVLFAIEILKRERPGLVYTNLFKPVDGENDMVTMLSSMYMNTRLRVFIIDTDSVKVQLKENIKSFLPGKDQHKLETP